MSIASEIAAKRQGAALDGSALADVAGAIADGRADDEAVAAFARAVYDQGFSDKERSDFTRAMRDTGEVIQWDLPGPVLDKHSTGGVGDAVSLILAPALAAVGAYVPMISGRGLGHTGGTLDKLASIPGVAVDQPIDAFRQIVAEAGAAIVSADASLAPADRRLYAIRDVTGTVDTLDLIVPSILSKKLATTLDALILDVKCGTGAFMADIDAARALARALVTTSTDAGLPAHALITDMNEPLLPAAGNLLEIDAVLACLKGEEVPARIWDVTLALGGDLLQMAGLAATRGEGQSMIAAVLQSGQAAERFAKMVALQGGPRDLLEHGTLTKAPYVAEVYAHETGFVTGIDTRALGEIVVDLGGGRRKVTDEIKPHVGLDWCLGFGLLVDGETPLARVHAMDEAAGQAAMARVRAAFTISDRPVEEPPLIIEQVRP